ncbi:uncharacterized protein Eint_030150 [Encephalitozoon intestinalis ATCC 50506]|uniref:SKI-interacting protein SKIP SNW domain-containing protein n=1 Tax=Encephalitozoon intestinalis (strain ATCC 50506) TaxID=876142 RepID=E0S626_ENCIT|nr:uncharacterized protein Eint_030150 [Encephalitozoon intestinalis ATCC 50506]ADM11161.1 hypothetical protein Eint_030150 [Encephalitozoon intestinalis ATCC 50506]UTX44827.1 SKIP/SNW domain-containing protein [Encephalitozoon intestinalis]
MGVKEIGDGKYGRVIAVSPDPLKITCKRGIKKDQKEAPKDIKEKPFRNKSKVKLFKCVSMWKNPTSQIISLESRIAHDRFRSIQPKINIKDFAELKSSLDNAEHLYSQDFAKRSIKEPEEIKELSKPQEPL